MQADDVRRVLAGSLPDPLGDFPSVGDGEITEVGVGSRYADVTLRFAGSGRSPQTLSVEGRVGRTSLGPEGEILRRIGCRLDGVVVPHPDAFLAKIVVFVPDGHQERVYDAMTEAGAGHIGNYDRTAFMTRGQGRFRPLDGARPFLGTPGETESADEWRMETVCPSHRIPMVLDAMRRAHPYEEVAYDLIRLLNPQRGYGYGWSGRFAGPRDAAEVVDGLGSSMQVAGLAAEGDATPVTRVALFLNGKIPRSDGLPHVDLGVGPGHPPAHVRAWVSLSEKAITRIRANWLLECLQGAFCREGVRIVKAEEGHGT